MLCISVAEKSFDACIEVLRGAEMAEIRLDLIPLTEQEIRKLFFLPVKTIATCRPDNIETERRISVIKTAIEAGATYVDIEIESQPSEKKHLVEYAKSKGCKVIISYHNFELTPEKKLLDSIVNDCFAQGADIAKIACMTKSPQDAARVLSLYDNNQSIIALGMGEIGKITRIAGPLLGAPFTFVSNLGKKTAPGQIDSGKMNSILNMIK